MRIDRELLPQVILYPFRACFDRNFIAPDSNIKRVIKSGNLSGKRWQNWLEYLNIQSDRQDVLG